MFQKEFEKLIEKIDKNGSVTLRKDRALAFIMTAAEILRQDGDMDHKRAMLKTLDEALAINAKRLTLYDCAMSPSCLGVQAYNKKARI